MEKISKNKNLHDANKAKNDEFYTQLSDIERELKHYKNHFKDKVVYCNCDDPRVSNFFRFFVLNFEEFGLKKLITTCYKNQNPNMFSQHDSEKAIYLEYDGNKTGNNMPDFMDSAIKHLESDGDFRSKECIELLKQVDIVVTNPPFSLFREYVAQLIEYDKKFLIIGNMNAISYKEIFPLIKENKLWLGVVSGAKKYIKPDGTFQNMGNTCWFTNLEHKSRNAELMLQGSFYSPEKHPKYDNYDAIEIGKVTDIPEDFDGVMGVPISFLDKYNPKQFEIVGLDRYAEGNTMPNRRMHINGKEIYARILIKRKK